MENIEESIKVKGKNDTYSYEELKGIAVMAEIYLDALIEDLRNNLPHMTKEMMILQELRDSDDTKQKVAIFLMAQINQIEKIKGK